ncbi:MAG: hypothetical protein CVU24_00620 [Betaproteobacteria bacterium HGW-Betaproteobacteria-18]|nr:MAG: hypothetical protein CVU24_00620 [Betaproteobacteria bacterium HGW-Betaproteobacteria-18]
MPLVAAASWDFGTWYDEVIGSPGSAVASMTVVEEVTVVRRGGPQFRKVLLALGAIFPSMAWLQLVDSMPSGKYK